MAAVPEFLDRTSYKTYRLEIWHTGRHRPLGVDIDHFENPCTRSRVMKFGMYVSAVELNGSYKNRLLKVVTGAY
ncbi:hypothetical protein TNCV_3730741 [Trichonephila clavipes]|nr:hypothetical protein TNCV_3730741 [Trichonephila clavipes]